MKLLGLAVATVALFGAALAEEPASSFKVKALDLEAEVLWDTWGVPHIYADTEEGLAFGFGYAHGRDHGIELLEMAAIAAGRSSEFKTGAVWETQDVGSYNDRIPQSAKILFDAMPPTDVAKFEAFAAGFDQYTLDFPDEYPRSEGFNQMLPMDGLDWFRTNMRVLFSFAFSGASNLQAQFEEKYKNSPDPNRAEREKDGKTYTSYMKWDPLEWAGIPDHVRHVMGSNAWAINSDRSSGNPMVNMNPHLPFGGFYRWYEAQLKCEACDVDIYGANLIGMPAIAIGFNENLGWTHTVNYGTPFSGFELALNPQNDNQYLYDGRYMDFTTEENVVRSLQDDGSYTERIVVTEYSVHGQIVSRTAGRAMAARIPGLDTTVKRPGVIEQWWAMGRAKNLDEFNDAMRQLQLPMFYVAVATRDDDIMLNWNGWVPDRGPEGCSKKQSEVRIVDGSSSANVWDDIIPWDRLPTVINPESGFVQNANEPPWSMAAPIGQGTLNPDNYCQYIVSDNDMTPRMGYRPQASWRLMETNENIDFEKFEELKMSTMKESANHILDDLLEAVEEFGGIGLNDAKEILTNWDRQMDNDSVGSLLWEQFMLAIPSASSFYINQWDPNDPINTPNGLRDPERAVDALRSARNRELLIGRPLDRKYGEMNELPVGPFELGGEKVPGNGCSDCFRNCYWVAGVPFAGDSFVGLVEFLPDGDLNARVSVSYGNAGPGSRGVREGHMNDQTTLFSEKKLRDAWRTRAEVEANLEERASISRIATKATEATEPRVAIE